MTNCKFWIIYGKNTLYYCGLDDGHKDNHLIAIPQKPITKETNGGVEK